MFNKFPLIDTEENTEDGCMIAQNQVGIDGRESCLEDLNQDLVQLLTVVRREV